SEKRRGVAGARADLERPIGRFRRESSEHERNHAGLADGLVLPDGKGAIFVRSLGVLGAHELVPRDLAECSEDPRILDTRIPRDVACQALTLFFSYDFDHGISSCARSAHFATDGTIVRCECHPCREEAERGSLTRSRRCAGRASRFSSCSRMRAFAPRKKTPAAPLTWSSCRAIVSIAGRCRRSTSRPE